MANDKRRLYGGRKRTSVSEDGEEKPKSYKSKSYDAFFEGYSVREDTRGGKVRYERVYEGDYWVPDLPRTETYLIRFSYLMLWIAAVGLLVYAGTAELRSSQSKVIGVLEAVSVVCLIWLLWKWLSYVMAGYRMTVGEYKTTSEPLIKAAAAASASFAVTAIICLIYIPLSKAGERGSTFLCFVSYLGGGIATIAIAVIERHLNYGPENGST